MDRIDKLCSYLDKCTTFADVGCDHGYCTRYMLKNGLCAAAVISDISAKCLQKAETLLAEYIKNGTVKSVCCNGLDGISEETAQVLIAGMGGEEIVSIFKNSFIPRSFVLQPMKNIRAVREYLLSNGAEISVDEPFESGGKFYYVIKGKRCGNLSIYGGQQLEFGLNLSGETTKKYIKSELKKKCAYLERNLNTETRLRIEEDIRFMEDVLKMKVEDVFAILEKEVAPVSLSDEFCGKYRMYDNSGIIINCGCEVTGALFTLDLTSKAVEKAKALGFNLIVTHHPAIFGGISKFDLTSNPQAQTLAECMRCGISVISMHLNFDAAPQGIDYFLCKGLGGENAELSAPLSNGGYGRVYSVAPTTFKDFVQKVKKEFSSERILSYGEETKKVNRVASFCGAGCDDQNISFAARGGADVFVSADMKHHEILAITQRGIAVIVLTHYASENYGFEKIYSKIKDGLKVKSGYFTDTTLL